MSVEEIKNCLTSLSSDEQSEVSAYLFRLRHTNDPAYQKCVETRLADVDPAHWLTPEEFERRLDGKQRGVVRN